MSSSWTEFLCFVATSNMLTGTEVCKTETDKIDFKWSLEGHQVLAANIVQSGTFHYSCNAKYFQSTLPLKWGGNWYKKSHMLTYERQKTNCWGTTWEGPWAELFLCHSPSAGILWWYLPSQWHGRNSTGTCSHF